MENKLERIIRQHVSLGRKNAKGWEPCLHITCDRGNKGDRAAFLFENNTTAFHCFNCGAKSVYDPSAVRRVSVASHPMVSILTDFNIPDDEWNVVLTESLRLRDAGVHTAEPSEAEKSISPPVLTIPESFYYIEDADDDDKWAEVARWYIEEERMLRITPRTFMLAPKSNDPMLKKWFGRLIVPVMKGGDCVYYQGRDMGGTKTKKYESPTSPKDCVLYGFDRLFERTDAPLYVVEGAFDAMLIDGVALMGNTLTPAHIAWLNKSPRIKVFIPDRYGNGRSVALDCLEQGWKVSVPYDTSWDSNIKDVTDMVRKYGKMFVMSEIAQTTADGFAAQTRLASFCKTEESNTVLP